MQCGRLARAGWRNGFWTKRIRCRPARWRRWHDCAVQQGGGVAIAERSAAEAAQCISDAFEKAAIPYAIGGALALAIAGVPRGTADVDVNVFLPEDRVADAMAVLAELGIDLPVAAAEQAKHRGMFVGRWDGMRIDVFLPSIPFAAEAERTRVRVTDDSGWSGWFLAPEALAVFKLLFFRGKDIVDLERLVAVRPELDKSYVRRHIVEMMGEDDDRTRRWDAITTVYG